MRKKMVTFVLLIISMILIVGCSGNTSDTSQVQSNEGTTSINFPGNKPIRLIVPWSAGGGSDIGARMLQPYLEEKLGTTVNVINPTGASGWIGWEQLLSADPDGYTIAVVNFPTLFPGYLDPSLGRSHRIEDFQMLANHVTDYCVLAIRKDDDRFNDLESFLAYAKENEVTISTSGIGSDDHVLVEKLIETAGLKLSMVAGDGWKDGYAALLGGHIDASAANVGEVLVPHYNGELLTLVVFSNERSEFMPDVPTWNEMGFGDDIVNSSQRGFATKAGTPQEIVDILAEALEYAINNQTQIDKMAEMGLAIDYIGPEEYTIHVKKEEQVMIDMSDIMGW